MPEHFPESICRLIGIELTDEIAGHIATLWADGYRDPRHIAARVKQRLVPTDRH